MSGEEDKDAKQFDPSESKLRKARDKGDVPRSTEITALAAFSGLALALALAGTAVAQWLARVTLMEVEPERVMDTAAAFAGQAGLWLTGLLMLPALAVFLALIVQRGLVFSGDKLKIDHKRIDPLRNFAQKFGRAALVTFGISLVKVALVGTGGWFLFGALFDLLAQSGYTAEGQWVQGIGLMLTRSLGLAIGISALLAILDYLWKRREFLTRNRMTRKEMQDEYKDSEGDPHLKQARRQRAVDLITAQMLADVEKADVVIVNPTHYAVALAWQRGSGRAPVCLAKGVDEVARRIRERAGDHGVPIWSDPPCARALHAVMEVGDEIPVEQFGPVAAAIRFAEAMRRKARAAGW